MPPTAFLLVAAFLGPVLAYPSYITEIECFQRVAVGKRLNETDIAMKVSVSTVRQCEQECEREKCAAFSFGISSQGNGTCDLAPAMPKEKPITNVDYDLFIKNINCINRTSCFRRLVTGRSLVPRLVRKTLFCDSLRSCEEACAQEQLFNCEGFNFRFDRAGYESKCQLTGIPGTMLDVTSDFNSDRDVDFFERDRNAPRSCFRPYSMYRPWNQYGQVDPWEPDYHGNHIGGGGGGGRPEYRPEPGSGGRPHLRPRPGSEPGGGSYPVYANHFSHESRPPRPPPAYGAVDSWDYPNYNGDKRYDYGGGQHAYGLGSGGWGLPDECFVRTKSGFRLERSVVVISLTVPSLYDCENECVNERKFTCNVFSFRYSLSPSVPGDNCHLGERTYKSLDPYTDVIPDRDYDIYERNVNGRDGCQPKRYWGSDCFERVRSGLRLDSSTAKYTLNAKSLSECESACIHVPFFTCRAFSYRYGPPVIGQSSDNCLLTDMHVPEMNPRKHFVVDPECELYHRGSYGHGCEIGRYPERGRPPISGPGGRPIYNKPEYGSGYFVQDNDRYPPSGHSHHHIHGNDIQTTFLPPEKPPGGYIGPDKPSNAYLPVRPAPPPPRPPGGYYGGRPGQYDFNEKPPYVGGRPGGYYHSKPSDVERPDEHHLHGSKPIDSGGRPGGIYYGYEGTRPGGDHFHNKPDIVGRPGGDYSHGSRPHDIGGRPGGVYYHGGKPHDIGGRPGGDYYHGSNAHAIGGRPGSHYFHEGKPQDIGGRPGDYYYGGKPHYAGGRPGGHYYYGNKVPVDYFYDDPRHPQSTYLPPSDYGIAGYQPRPSDHMCYIRYSTAARLLPSAIRSAIRVDSEQECKAECTRARENTVFRCATISYRGSQCELSDIEQRDLRPGYDYLPDKDDFWMFTWDFGTSGCYYPPPPRKPVNQIHGPYDDRGVESTWARFTVNGQPCRAGTFCTQNPEVGVWTCPVDNGDWDYCCRSGHHCGYSDGYPYPWCYVGSAEKDQWRPCSDSYYPYSHSARKLHWPVAYLHQEGPPNVTISHQPSIVDSFLASLDKEEGRRAEEERRAENERKTENERKLEEAVNATSLLDALDIEPRIGDAHPASAMTKLWTWGQSKYNSSTPSDGTTLPTKPPFDNSTTSS